MCACEAVLCGRCPHATWHLLLTSHQLIIVLCGPTKHFHLDITYYYFYVLQVGMIEMVLLLYFQYAGVQHVAMITISSTVITFLYCYLS